MSYLLKKINDIEIKPLNVNHAKPEEIMGYDIIPMLYSNIFICGKKGSGKSNIVFTIMKHCIDKNTKVVIFCSTIFSDPNWLAIKEWLEKREQSHVCYSSIYDDSKTSNLQTLIDKIKQDDEDEQTQIQEKKKAKTNKDVFKLFQEEKTT